MRLNADGSVDGIFNQGGVNGIAKQVKKIICQPDGKILVCGITRYQGVPVNELTR